MEVIHVIDWEKDDWFFFSPGKPGTSVCVGLLKVSIFSLCSISRKLEREQIWCSQCANLVFTVEPLIKLYTWLSFEL